VSADKHQLLGIIDSSTLESLRVLSKAYEKGISRQELTVHDMMTSATKLVALRDSDTRKCTIADVPTTLQRHGSQHILILDTITRSILGIISASDIAWALHVPVDISYRASSFQEVFNSLYCHKDLS
jgi:hypothetical protein